MSWLQPDRPFAPRRLPFFYGWVVLAVSTLGMVMSIPGQTMGVSVFTDHLIEATGLTRLQLSNTYLLGTTVSGLLLPFGGTLLDRFGARPAALAATTGLALTLLYLSVCDRIAAWAAGILPGVGVPTAAAALLAVGFTALRFSGQGMLTMASRNMLAKWWNRRRGRMSGISGIFISFGFASAPLLLHVWIEAATWRGAWLGMAGLVGVGMGVVVLLFFRDNPEECGLAMDGDAVPAQRREAVAPLPAAADPGDATRAQAVRTLAFWVVTAAVANQSMVITAVTFHIVDIGAENGMSAASAVGIFLPVAVVSTSFGYAVGVAVDRFPIRGLVVGMQILQVMGFFSIAHMGESLWWYVAVAGWGGASGFFGPLTVAALPRFFGRSHLGAISSVQMMCLVVASAVGPSFLAGSREWLGSYAPALYASCLLPVLVALGALAMREPHPRTPHAG